VSRVCACACACACVCLRVPCAGFVLVFFCVFLFEGRMSYRDMNEVNSMYDISVR